VQEDVAERRRKQLWVITRNLPLDAVLDEWTTVRQELVVTAGRMSAGQWEQSLSFPWGGTGTIAQALGGLA
jgi:hypothetical protein